MKAERRKVKSQLQTYLQWPLILSILIFAANVAVLVIEPNAGGVMVPFTLAYIAIAGWLFWTGNKRLQNGLVSYAADYSWSQKQLLASMELPYGIADTDGKFLWMNRALKAVLKDEKSGKRSLTALFKEITPESLKKLEHSMEVQSSYGDAIYRVSVKRVHISADEELLENMEEENKEDQLLAVYLYDETELHGYIQAFTDQKMVAGLIYLDNYDEALESVEEVRRSLLVALIDRKINKYISGINGIVKKMEKDKYFFAIKQQYMARLEEERFGLLEDVKTVNIGNEMAVTLSIGIGMNGDTYVQNYDYARTAIDMALGRGGDQAVVKNGSKIQYFGGKSQQLEKQTRVKARVKAHAMRELLETKDRLLIMGHKIGDTDSFGSAIGMYRIAMALNKKAHIVLNDITSSVRPMYDRFDKSSEYPSDMFVTSEEAKELVDNGTAIVVAAALMNALKVVGKQMGQIKIVINGAGSAGCAIAKLLLDMQFGHIILCDKKGILQLEDDLTMMQREIVTLSPPRMEGSLANAMKDADVFIGVSAPNVVSKEMVASMATKAIVFPMANPNPEITRDDALAAGAMVVGTGRSDFPNQINNVLAFPGIFKGALAVRASDINEAMKHAAAKAIASMVSDEQLSKDYIIPSALNKEVASLVANAVAMAAKESGVARI